MIQLVVEEKTYKKGTPWRYIAIDEDNALISSIDSESDEIQVYFKEDNKFYLKKDITIKFYYAIPKTDVIGDLLIIEKLNHFSRKNPNKLRCLFRDVPIGEHILETTWIDSKKDNNDNSCLECWKILDNKIKKQTLKVK